MSSSSLKGVAALAAALLLASPGCRCRDVDPPAEGGQQGSASGSAGQKKLAALPYLNWVPVKADDEGKSSITRHDKGRTSPGLNFYNSRPRHEAVLMDMNGKPLHRWRSDRDQPDTVEQAWSKVWAHFDFAGWHHSELLPDGSVLAIVHYKSVLKVGWDGELLFAAPVAAHHDLDVADNGDILVLDAAPIKITLDGKERLYLDNGVTVLSPDGKLKARHSLYEIFTQDPLIKDQMQAVVAQGMKVYDDALASGYRAASKMTNPLALSTMSTQLRAILDGQFKGSDRTRLMFLTQLHPIDMFHANSLEIVRQDRPGLWRKGDLLLSLRSLNVVLVLDLKRSRVRWHWGQDVLMRQHHPSLLPGGNILLFDNGTEATGSRVVEVDPKSEKIVWTYRGKKPADFFSIIRGGCQRLPGGNTLITDSESGRALEVNRAGDMVWEFYNPDMALVHIALLRAPIYRVTRFPAEMFSDQLSK